MKIKNYILSTTNWKFVSQNNFNVILLPWGATEAHNFHLPYATDVFQAEYVAAESARIAVEKNAKVMVLPAIPFGVNTGQLDIKLCINMNPSTQEAVLHDVVYSLKEEGFNKLVIVNSHGGNDFKQMIREIQQKIPNFFIGIINWYKITDNKKFFDEPGDHAGELETAVMMKIAPELVLPLSEAGDGNETKFKLKGLKEGWVWSQRQWTKISKDTGVGNPEKATLEKGEKYLKYITETIADFLVELDKADINNLYE